MCICNKIFEIVIFIILLKQSNHDIDVSHDTETSFSFLAKTPTFRLLGILLNAKRENNQIKMNIQYMYIVGNIKFICTSFAIK
jgi:hypothetical protein